MAKKKMSMSKPEQEESYMPRTAIMMSMPLYEGMIRDDLIRAARQSSRLDSMPHEMHREILAADLAATGKYLAQSGLWHLADHLNSERERLGFEPEWKNW